MEFFENLGFSNHPFVHTNADEEPYLEQYFVPPPFFEGVKGDPDHPTSVVVLAPRGSGKSAQRRQLELWAEQNRVLAVTYDRFEFGAGQSLESIGLPYHLRNVITLTLVTYLSYLADYPDTIRTLSKNEKNTLAVFVHSYLGDATGLQLRDLLKELKSLPQRLRDFWTENVGILDSVVNFLMRTYDLPSFDTPDLRQEEKKLSESYKNQLGLLWDLVSRIGFRSIYILIDKPDESEKTGNSPEATYRLIQPLMQDLELLSTSGFAFKFFLWDQITPFFREHARPDRVPQHELAWSRTALETALSKRLSAFSKGTVNKFVDLMSEDPGYPVDTAICMIANRSPRNVVRICEKIFAVQAELGPSSNTISDQAVERGIDLYCDQVVNEVYEAQIPKDLQKVGRELFTINFLANDVFKTTHVNTSRNRVTAWQNTGVVRQIGSVSTPDAKRPVNFYCIIDPAMTRLIHRATPIKEFMEERWIPCVGCGRDNLTNLNLVPEGNQPECFGCGRPLI